MLTYRDLKKIYNYFIERNQFFTLNHGDGWYYFERPNKIHTLYFDSDSCSLIEAGFEGHVILVLNPTKFCLKDVICSDVSQYLKKIHPELDQEKYSSKYLWEKLEKWAHSQNLLD